MVERVKPKFAGDTGFHREVTRRVTESFRQRGLSTRDCLGMYVKTAVLLIWFVASYLLLVFAATEWWHALGLIGSLALAMGGVSFAVQHDGNHGAYSRRGAINRLAGLTLDLMGGSSYVWKWKHNIAHHTYTSLPGADGDIDVPFGRLSPAQPLRRMHRAQHIYLWLLYGLFVAHWQLYQDFAQLLRGRIAGHRFPRPRGWRLVELVAGKACFFGWAFVLPAFFHPWWVVLLGYAATSVTLSYLLVLVFQLAHSVEEAAVPPLPAGASMVPWAWAEHQVQATADFARGNRPLSWYLGGLNFQIEHHLFPRICHLHYPRIAPIVQATCADYGVRYAANRSFFAALGSHARRLRRLGRPVGPLEWLQTCSRDRSTLHQTGGKTMRLSDDTLRNRTVISSDGIAIGEIAALFLDSDAWRMESLQVKLRKEVADRLGADRGMFHAGTLEIPTRMIQSVGDAIILSVKVDELRQVIPRESESAPAP